MKVADEAIANAAPLSEPVSAIEAQNRDGRVVVMVLDRSIPFGAPAQIARLVARSVVQAMAPNDIGAVIYTGSSQRSQDLTGDRARRPEV